MKNNIYEFILSNVEYLKDIITRSTYNSNGIEGSTLTYAETYALLYNDNSFKINNKEPREIYEVINHKIALELMFEKLKEEDNKINESIIKQFNEIINKNIKDTKGYRKIQVFIQGTDFVLPSPEKINGLMNYWFDNYINDVNDIFYRLAMYHIKFESIHPFEDGNGRTGRLIINYELLRNGLPPIVISKDDRVKYFELFRNNDINNMSEWFKELCNNELERLKTFGYMQ